MKTSADRFLKTSSRKLMDVLLMGLLAWRISQCLSWTEEQMLENETSVGARLKSKRCRSGGGLVGTLPWTLKLGFLGAFSSLKLPWYWGAAVQGEWGAGVDTIMKNGRSNLRCRNSTDMLA